QGAAVAAAGVGHDDLGGRIGVARDHGREQRCVFAFVQDVTGDDHVEAAQRQQRALPVELAVVHRWQPVERRVVGDEGFGQRVDVRGDDVGAAALQYQAGQTDATA